MPIRVKCSCGNVINTEFGAICTQCKQKLNIPEDGMLYLYRKGSPIGIAGGFGIYIDEKPYGYIGNKESLHIPLSYGTHRLHVACGLNRRCNDLLIDITPQNRVAFTKVWMKPGFWTNSFVLEVAERNEMPSTMYIENYVPTAIYSAPSNTVQHQNPVQSKDGYVYMNCQPEGNTQATPTKKVCPTCGFIADKDVNFCQNCGTRLV